MALFVASVSRGGWHERRGISFLAGFVAGVIDGAGLHAGKRSLAFSHAFGSSGLSQDVRSHTVASRSAIVVTNERRFDHSALRSRYCESIERQRSAAMGPRPTVIPPADRGVPSGSAAPAAAESSAEDSD